MRLPLVIAFAVTGCQYLIGIEGTKVQPDGPPIDTPMSDAAIDSPPPPMVIIGDGADGPLTVTGTTYTDEVRTVLTMPVLASSTALHVTSAAGFFMGDEVLIMQMDGPNRGQYEIVGVMSSLSTQLLGTPLAFSYESSVQVIRVPNYTSVTIAAGGVVTAHPWDPVAGTGGIVAFRASEGLEIEEGGTLHADELGYLGGDPGPGGPGGEGQPGGGGGAFANCALGICNTNLPAKGGFGGTGESVDALGAPGQPGNAATSSCFGGTGGRGGLRKDNGMAGTAGAIGTGWGGGATSSAGGQNATLTIRRPLLAGGGAGGKGGAGGSGAGGGGGGGGPAGQQNTTNGVTGGKGEDGGVGGSGGMGGRGGGIILVHASSIVLAGVVSASGAPGAAALAGGDGGKGGTGGASGNLNTLCAGTFLHGGRGGGGQGGNGGNGGDGGGGGGGGVVELNAFTVTAGGEVRAVGGAGGTRGSGGLAGPGGTGFDNADDEDDGAKPGSDGIEGADGNPGSAGLFYVRYTDSCTDCDAFGDPPAVVEQL